MKATILYIGVTPEEQKKGYGSLMLSRAEQYVLSLGIDVLFVKNGIAKEFYVRNGYTEFEDKLWRKSLNVAEYTIPDEAFESEIRIVPEDDDTNINLHHIVWYKRGDGSALAKVKIEIQ